MTNAAHGSTPPLDEAKKSLRTRVLARLKHGVTPARRRDCADDLCRRAAAVLQAAAPCAHRGGRCLHIALYAPMEHEVDLLPLLEQFPEHRFHFPRCLPGRGMEFCRVCHPHEEFERDRYGIRSPLPSLAAIDPRALDIIFVPGVAFTPEGHRLGYGGGYYDRFLPRCPQAATLACILPEQLVAALPVGKYDRPVGRLLVAGQPEDGPGA